jgi:hypothetical protein
MARRGARSGQAQRHRRWTISVVHSKASLREIPEVDFSKYRTRRNRYVGRGRPKRMLEVGGTIPRSVRFPATVWAELEKRAQKKGLTLHAALREAILAWLKRAA